MAAFIWNFSGFWGAVFGSTLWILLAGIRIYDADAVASCLLLGFFSVPWIAGFVIWRSRHRMTPIRGYLLLIGSAFVAALGTLMTLDKVGVLGDQPGAERFPPYLLLGIFPLLAIMFVLKNRDPGPR